MTQPLSDISDPQTAAFLEQLQTLMERPEAELQAMLLEAQKQGDFNLQVGVVWSLGGQAYFQADYLKCLDYNEAAWKICQENDVYYVLQVNVLNGLALSKKRMGRYDEGLDHLLDSLKLARAHGDTYGHLRAIINVAMLHLENGEAEQALVMHEQGLKLARGSGDLVSESACLCGMATNYLELKRYQDVVDLTQQHLPFIRENKEPGWLANLMADTSFSLMKLGRLEEALSTCLYAQQELLEEEDRQGKFALCRTHGVILLELGQPEETVRLLEEKLPLLLESKEKTLASQFHWVLADAFKALGDYQAALEHFGQHYHLEKELHSLDMQVRSKSLSAQLRLELVEREAEVERLRNVELVEANRVLQETQYQLVHQATHDALTGVLNRSAFLSLAQGMLDDLPAESGAVMLFIDLDHFKSVNDAYGHPVGDELLQHLAQRLKGMLRENDVLGRMGGDEFMVFMPDVPHTSDTQALAQSINEALAQPFHLTDHVVEITASVGFTSTYNDSLNAEILQKHADMAMYHVKRHGRHDCAAYVPHMSVELQRRQQLELELRGAEARGELLLHYQACFSVKSSAAVGFEALIRWEHPKHGLIPPGEFIPIAEDTRLILPIGQWVLHEACTQAMTWAFPARGLTMSVNVSALQFEQPDFVQQVSGVLQATGLPAQHLILEVTESLVLRDLNLTQRHTHALQRMGVQLAMDDFGTGYSSLSALHSLPFNHLKIDRSFLKAHGQTPQTPRLMMETMIRMAHHLNMKVTAEGVEEAQHLALLNELNCDQSQGFHLARPEPAEKAQRHLDMDYADVLPLAHSS